MNATSFVIAPRQAPATMLRVDVGIHGTRARVIFCEVPSGGAIATDLHALPGDGSGIVDEAGATCAAYDIDVDPRSGAPLASAASIIMAAALLPDLDDRRRQLRRAVAYGLLALLQATREPF